ncbi:MAG: glycosyltransferase family 2 protein [Candidatus Micrarchaeaceae archaeon]
MYKNMEMSVIMPIYNEGTTAYNIITRVLKQSSVDRLIIVYDKSTDNTLEEVKRAIEGSKKAILVYSNEKLGKGHAVKEGMKLVKKGMVLIQDADEEYYPEDYPKLLKAFDSKHPIFGRRAEKLGHVYLLGRAAAKVHTVLFNVLYGQSLEDINTCYKLFDVSMLKGIKLRENGWTIDHEIAIRLAKNGYKIKEVPIRYKGRTYEEGKKVGASAAIEDALYIIKARFSK